MDEPVICFGQQPCGFFPKRFLYSKIITARKLREKIGGKIVFFFHDSDHDHRETMTILEERHSQRLDHLNFLCENSLQKKYSPLYAKRIEHDWKANMHRQLPNYVDKDLVDLFGNVKANAVADFCLEMYRGMGLVDDMEIVRSSDPNARRQAIAIDDYYVDVEHDGECVRARKSEGKLLLHKGGDVYIELQAQKYDKSKISPARDTRLPWMQSIVQCSHYIAGASEIKYMNTADTPEINFIERDFIDRLNEAYVGKAC